MHDDWKKQRLEWPDEDSPTVDGRKFRSISPTFGITCTSAYAITREGARSLLYNVGYKELWQPVDLAMKTKFEEGRLKGYTVFPTMFSQWKIGHGKDSDTGNDQNVEQVSITFSQLLFYGLANLCFLSLNRQSPQIQINVCISYWRSYALD